MPPSESALKKCGDVEGNVEYIMRHNGHWWVGINSGTRQRIPGRYTYNAKNEQVPCTKRVYLAADECAWSDDEVEVLEGDLDWYGRIREGLHTAEALT
ncbi:MAG: hypothetical protein GWN58_27735 [Anaerolineae bacterium]|nr:hypothetical protein [Anaerolineae bacterium]